jgi:hypothetical protein
MRAAAGLGEDAGQMRLHDIVTLTLVALPLGKNTLVRLETRAKENCAIRSPQ